MSEPFSAKTDAFPLFSFLFLFGGTCFWGDNWGPSLFLAVSYFGFNCPFSPSLRSPQNSHLQRTASLGGLIWRHKMTPFPAFRAGGKWGCTEDISRFTYTVTQRSVGKHKNWALWRQPWRRRRGERNLSLICLVKKSFFPHLKRIKMVSFFFGRWSPPLRSSSWDGFTAA